MSNSSFTKKAKFTSIAIPLIFVAGLTTLALVAPANAATYVAPTSTSSASTADTTPVVSAPVSTSTPTVVSDAVAPVTEVVTPAPVTDTVVSPVAPAPAEATTPTTQPAPVVSAPVVAPAPAPVVAAPVTEIGTAISTPAPVVPSVGTAIGEVAPGTALGDCQMGGYKFAAHATTEDCGNIFAAYDDNVKNAASYKFIGSSLSEYFDANGNHITSYNGFVINSGQSDISTWNTVAALDQVVRDINNKK